MSVFFLLFQVRNFAMHSQWRNVAFGNVDTKTNIISFNELLRVLSNDDDRFLKIRVLFVIAA